MTLSPSDIAHASVRQMYAALDGILEKGALHSKDKGVEEAIYLEWRLAPDMFPLTRQVQIASELPARGLARLARADLPSFADNEKTFAELRERVAAAKKFISGLDRAAIDADPDGEISFPVGPDTMTMKRRDYLLNFVLPNLYFHVTAAYALLRACGAPLGKADFLARPR